jgi:hypothetical protein
MHPDCANSLGAFGRDLRDEDLTECLEINPVRIGDELVGRARATEIWKTLSRSPSFNSTVIEPAQPIKGHRIVCFGCAAFVTQAFARAELSNPRHGLNSRIIASIDSGQSVVLSESELRSGNTIGGLDMVILFASWRRDLLDRAGVSEVSAVASANFMEANLGYRFNGLIMETAGVEEATHCETMHIWRAVRKFDEPGGPARSLWAITREDALVVNGSIANPLFHYSAPVLRLRAPDQRLLLAANRGFTDEELSLKLGISLTAVKKRWLSIFASTIDARPDLFPGIDLPKDGEKRGRQKRHHVLAYIRTHPQELRPFAHSARISNAVAR